MEGSVFCDVGSSLGGGRVLVGILRRGYLFGSWIDGFSLGERGTGWR